MKQKVAFFIFAITAWLCFTTCAKSTERDCDAIQKERFQCYGKETDREVYKKMVKAIYKSEVVYYVQTVSPFYTLVSPTYGLNCQGDTIRFDSFENVAFLGVVAICD